MNKDLFYQYLKFPELLDDRSVSDLEKIVEGYPYFQSAHLLYLKNLNNQGNITYDKELKKTAIWVNDRTRLFYLLDKRVLLPVSEPFLIPEKRQPSNTFDFTELSSLTDFPEKEHQAVKIENDVDDELSQLIMSGAAQTSSFFNVDDTVDLDDFKKTFKKKKDVETSKPAESGNESKRKLLIDKFITEQPKIVPAEENVGESVIHSDENEKPDPDLITDTLAKIYIKQGLYEKAINAYEKLSLKYPEKNIYFAGQIKKIKQLISNQ